MRAKTASKHQIQPDEKYQSVIVARLINRVMRDGKRSVAQKQVYDALEQVAAAQDRPAVELLEEALERVRPQMEVRSRRVGGAAYQVPMPVKPRRASSLAIRWLIQAAQKRSNREYHSFSEKLAAELSDALTEQGGAIDRKQTAHKMADANKAFAHFRW